MSLMLGPIGLLFLAFGVGVIFIGIGLYQQQWVAQMLAKICCAILVVQQTYMLIASPFLAAAGAHYSSATSIFLILFFSFQLYVIWSVSD